MHVTVPLQLGQLLSAPDAAVREAAWDELVAAHTRLLLATTRSFGGGHDEAMDRYSYVLEKLREGDFRRLRAFSPGKGASFSTFLTVAARRLCLDFHRTRYGRKRSADNGGEAEMLRDLRRSLLDSHAQELEAENLPDSCAVSAEDSAVREERDSRLRAALRSLPARDRLILVLRYNDDLTASQIASLLAMRSPFHAYRAVNTVLARLRAALESSGVDGVDG